MIKLGGWYEKEFNELKLKMEELKSFAKERAIGLTKAYPDIPYNESGRLTLSKYLSFLMFDDKDLNVSADQYIRVVKIAEKWIEKQSIINENL
jgi:hypothetical protein